MTYILFEIEEIQTNLLPFTYTRPIAHIRCGILTIKEKWEKVLGEKVLLQCQEPLDDFFSDPLPKGPKLYINSSLLPNPDIINRIKDLKDTEGIKNKDILLAYNSTENLDNENLSTKQLFELSDLFDKVDIIKNNWDIFKMNASQIKSDFELLKANRKSAAITDENTKVYGLENIFVEEGAVIKAAILNAETGPIYIGKNAKIEEGAIIRGSFALCENSTVNTGAKIRGDSTVGPFSKVGGEVSNSVIFGYSNKGHDGFMGNSVIAEWCNIGADTNTSNLKNNYDEVKLWNFTSGRFEKTGEQFCGLIMGDHSKCGINTMFNTGTVVGVGANVFGSGFPANFIPSFFWGGPQGKATFSLKKMLETAEIVMKRRDVELNDKDRKILSLVFKHSAKFRPWD